MSTPVSCTPEEIKTVQANLKNMQALNDAIYSNGLSRYLNAFALLTEQDDNDLGLTIGLNIVEGAFWAVGSVAGPAGSFFASFLSGMLVYWATNPPASINGSFAQNVIRFQATSEAVDTQLAVYYQDVKGHWNDSFTYNGKTYALSDLATLKMPAETDTDWKPMLDAALLGVDQALWTALLVAHCVVTFWEYDGTASWNGASLDTEEQDPNSPPISWAQGFYKVHPGYYEPWTWYSGDPNNCCGPPACWAVAEYNLGTGAGAFSDGALSDDACNYLFIDSTPGVTINANGLFNRVDLFTNLGIPTATYVSPNYDGGAGARLDNVSVGFLRAMKDQQTLGQLLAREGREKIERRIVKQAQDDPVFAHDLQMRPRMTVEKFLGVKIPEVIALHVLQELPWSFGIVIPARNLSQLNAPSTGVPAQGAKGAGAKSAPAAPIKEGLERFFGTAPQAAAPAAANITAVYQVTLSGPDGGDWVLRVQKGKVTAEKGRVDNPDVTLRASASDWLDMATGRLDSLLAFFVGRLAVEGDVVLARKLRDILPPPKATVQGG